MKHASYDIGAIYNAADDCVQELRRAREKFGAMASAHEGLSVMEEELHELRMIVYQKQTDRDYVKMRKEAVQLAAMALAFIIEICDTDNRR